MIEYRRTYYLRIKGIGISYSSDVYFPYIKEISDGKLHRDGDLPAIEWADGYKEYWKNGIRYSPNQEIKNIVLSHNEKISISFNGHKITIATEKV